MSQPTQVEPGPGATASESDLLPAVSKVDRRQFLGRVGTAAAGTLGVVGLAADAEAGHDVPNDPRIRAAYQLRVDAAALAARRPQVGHPANRDEATYRNRIGSFSKGLPHDFYGEVDAGAYQSLLAALGSGEPAAFEQIPLGGTRRLVNPQAGFAFDLQGADSHHLTMPPAPPLASQEAADELIEVYWMALARDIPFSEWDADPLIAAACGDLSRLARFYGPRSNGVVTPRTLFRGTTLGDLTGPYLSQFLWLNLPMGALPVEQRMVSTVPDLDFGVTYGDWLTLQNGDVPGANLYDPTPRYIRSLRDLAQWVHIDALYQAYHQACLILLGMNAPFGPGLPYGNSRTQEGFGTFGGPHVLSLVTEVATRALKAAWFQKWLVHRRLRPEAMAGLVHQTLSGMRRRPIHPDVLGSGAMDQLYRRFGSLLLPLAYAEGSPTHPSYPAGHATVAGACTTILKAWFDESFVLPDPVTADRSGLFLEPYSGPPLTVGNELNKVAANIAIGRNAAGVHFRSEYYHSVRLGEQVAISILEEQKATYREPVTFRFTNFDGAQVTV